MQSTDGGHTESVLPSTKSRTLCKDFMSDLTDGFLSALRKKVAEDDTLMISRNGYINLYYRGGSLMKLTRNSKGNYTSKFDANFCNTSQTAMPDLPMRINNTADCDAWVGAIPTLKDIMNAFFARHRWAEREFQQLVVWENNRSSVSNKTEYFITDIEYAVSAQGAKLDMLGLKWRPKDDKSGSRCKPVLIEMKWGDGAYDGNAGIIKHVSDIVAILEDKDEISNIRQTIKLQFNQLNALGMLRFKLSQAVKLENIEVVGDPELVFILANHNPRSRKLGMVLESVEMHEIVDRIKNAHKIDLRFFVASFAGFGLHDACMLNLDDFQKLVASFTK